MEIKSTAPPMYGQQATWPSLLRHQQASFLHLIEMPDIGMPKWNPFVPKRKMIVGCFVSLMNVSDESSSRQGTKEQGQPTKGKGKQSLQPVLNKLEEGSPSTSRSAEKPTNEPSQGPDQSPFLMGRGWTLSEIEDI